MLQSPKWQTSCPKRTSSSWDKKAQAASSTIWIPEAGERGALHGDRKHRRQTCTFCMQLYIETGSLGYRSREGWTLSDSLLRSRLASLSLFSSNCLFSSLEQQETNFILPQLCCFGIRAQGPRKMLGHAEVCNSTVPQARTEHSHWSRKEELSSLHSSHSQADLLSAVFSWRAERFTTVIPHPRHQCQKRGGLLSEVGTALWLQALHFCHQPVSIWQHQPPRVCAVAQISCSLQAPFCKLCADIWQRAAGALKADRRKAHKCMRKNKGGQSEGIHPQGNPICATRRKICNLITSPPTPTPPTESP